MGDRFTTDRRSFLRSAAALLLALPSFARGQILIERGGFDEQQFPLVREKLLNLLNDERAAAGLNRLQLDDLASKVATDHANDMIRGQFLSHWGSDGRNAYHRYSFAGGIDALQENVGLAENIQSLAPNSVHRDFLDIHQDMFSEVPPDDGHRRTILDAHHSHVGFGLAFQGHNLRLDELYLARYLRIDPFPGRAKPKSTVVLTGKLLNARHFLYEVYVFSEPLPAPPDLSWLRTPRHLSLPDQHIILRPKTPPGTYYIDGGLGDYDWGGGKFRVPVKLSQDVAGIYTVLFWIRRAPSEKPFAAAQVCIVSQP